MVLLWSENAISYFNHKLLLDLVFMILNGQDSPSMTGVKESNYDRCYLTLSYMATILKRGSHLDVQHMERFSFLFFKQTI